MGLSSEMEQENKPKWLLELENRKRKPRLAHEIGAGAPCIKCSTSCPGLDLHFWRKICKNCKCSRDDHDVPNDEFPQFDLLFGQSGKSKRRMVVLKVDQKETSKEETFEWAPPDTTTELATDYMKALPKEKLPIKGTAGAALRKQQLQKQLPLHDIDHKVCDELSESERKQFERYLENLKKYVGQGKVTKFVTAKPFDKSLMTPANASECLSPKHNSSSTDIPLHLRTPSSFVSKSYQLPSGLNQEELLALNQGLNLLPNDSNQVGSRQEILGNPALGQMSVEASKLGRYHHALANMRNESDIVNSTEVSGSRGYSMNNQDIKKNVQYSHLLDNLKNNSNYSTSTEVPGCREYSNISQGINKDYPNPQSLESIQAEILHSRIPEGYSAQSEILNNKPLNSALNFTQSNLHSEANVKSQSDLANLNVTLGGNAEYLNNSQQTENNLQNPQIQAQILHSRLPDGYSAHSEALNKSLNPALNFAQSNLHSNAINSLPVSSDNLPYVHQLQKIRGCHPEESSTDQRRHGSQQWSSKIGGSSGYPDTINTNNQEQQNSILADKILSEALLPPSSINSGDIIGSTLDKKGLSYIREKLSSKYSEQEESNDQNIVQGKNATLLSKKSEAFHGKPAQAHLSSYGGVHPHVIHSENLQNPVFPEEVVGSTQIMNNPAGIDFLGSAMDNLSMIKGKVQNCHQCQEDILVDDVVVTAEKAKDAAWHPGCFVCSVCNELLVDLVYFYYKGKLYCGRDLAGLLEIPRCFACDELIFVREYTVAEGHNYHVKHFCCWDCDVPLAGQQYISENDRPLCLPCYQKGYAKTCGTCYKVIAADQQGVAVKNVDFHASDECFCCASCKKSLLNGRMAIKEDKPFCSKECIAKFLNNQ